MFLSWLKPSLKFSRRETLLSDKSLIKNLLKFSCRLMPLMMRMRRKSRFVCAVRSFMPLFQPPLILINRTSVVLAKMAPKLETFCVMAFVSI